MDYEIKVSQKFASWNLKINKNIVFKFKQIKKKPFV